MNAQPNLDYWNAHVNYESKTHNLPNWYEVLADDEKVKVFPDLFGADKFINDERYTDALRDKVLKIVAFNKVQSRDEHGRLSFTCDALSEKLIHEEHPTVLECRPPDCWFLESVPTRVFVNNL